MKFFAELYGEASKIGEVIDRLDLAKDRNKKFDNLSGGMKQKVGIASAIVHDPEVIFLDEPTTGLDPKSRREVWDFITHLKEKGKTIFLTSHYMEEARLLSDRVGIINKGKIAALDTPAKLIEQYGGMKKVALQVKDKAIEDKVMRDFDVIRENGKLTVYLSIP